MHRIDCKLFRIVGSVSLQLSESDWQATGALTNNSLHKQTIEKLFCVHDAVTAYIPLCSIASIFTVA